MGSEMCIRDRARVADGFRLGVRLAIDWGKARVGVAACDREGLLCYPVTTLATAQQPLHQIVKLIDKYEPIELLLGWPVNLAGQEGPAASAMQQVADQLVAQTSLPVRLVDERMTSATAAKQLAASGKSARQRRAVIDQAAAVAILEQAIAVERSTGRPAGRLHAFPNLGDFSE